MGERHEVLTRADEDVVEALPPTRIRRYLIRFDRIPNRHDDSVEGVSGVNLEHGHVVSWRRGGHVQVTDSGSRTIGHYEHYKGAPK